MKPLVSVCIPTYNGAKYLKECLDSVLVQTFTNFELLIVDDQSSDDTYSIAQTYATHDQRIRVIRNEQNLGLVGNWNRCIELAQAEWIKFVFQDDLIEPVCLERMLAVSKPESTIICCRRNFIFETGTPESTRDYYLNHLLKLENLFPGLTEISAKDYCEATLNYIGINFVGEPTAIMLHRKAFEQFGIFNPHLIQVCDLEFWARVAIHTGLIYVQETLATFRVHGGATSAANQANKYRAWELEALILIHEFAYHPTFAPLRTAASQHQPAVNFANLLARRVYKAWKIAKRAATDSENPNSYVLAEWDKIIYLYPTFLSLSKRSFLVRAFTYFPQSWSEVRQRFKQLQSISISRHE